MPYIPPADIEIATPRQRIRTTKPEVPVQEQKRTKQRLRLYDTLNIGNWDVPVTDIFPQLFEKE